MFFISFYRQNVHLFNKFALSNRNYGLSCLLCYYYNKDKRVWWRIGCNNYFTEAIRRIESIFGDIPNKNTSMQDGYYPKVDIYRPLNDKKHQIYQMLIGILK